ncbi:MAG: glucose sorbosone dehydrogenase [Halobacteriovoraceae bacterium]|nr:glucose sorbosone dehydrogenase [Halobacteriovoraceae bacterium]
MVFSLLLCFLLVYPSQVLGTVKIARAFPNLIFEKPLFLLAPPDGSNRLFVIEQKGKIHSFANRNDVKKTTLFLNMGSSVGSLGREEGLLGMAFDPAFKKNGYFYLYYNKYFPRRTVLSRLKVANHLATSASMDSEKVLLEIKQPYSNHNGGMLAFGPDGFLYVGVGDGGYRGDPKKHGQNRNSLLGSILRLNPSAENIVPKSNPFVGKKEMRPEIWAYGLRNPWRFSFDRKNGELWVGDVGQDKREEISKPLIGDNLGWNKMEGNLPYKGASFKELKKMRAPVFDYSRREGKSITGGYVYRGKKHPELFGKYLYADFVSGRVWTLSKLPLRQQTKKKLYSSSLLGEVRLPSSFGEDSNGELYILSFNGSIYSLGQ